MSQIEKKDDRRVRKTKKALREGFAKLLSQKSVKDISVKELTDLVDLHRGTFYLHYRDVYDLQEQIEKEMVQEFRQILGDSFAEGRKDPLLSLNLLVFTYLKENRELCEALLGKYGDIAFVNRLTDIVRQYCIQVFSKRFQNESKELYAYCSEYVVSGAVGLIRYWAENGMQESPEEMGRILQPLVLSSLKLLEGKQGE